MSIDDIIEAIMKEAEAKLKEGNLSFIQARDLIYKADILICKVEDLKTLGTLQSNSILRGCFQYKKRGK